MKNKLLWKNKADIIGLNTRPLRVVMVGDSFLPLVDGVVRVMENYIEQFQQKNVEFLILAPAYTDYDLSEDKKLNYKPFRIKPSVLKWGGYQVIRTPLVQSELNVIDNFNPDIIHVHSPFFAGSIGNQLKKRYNIPVILTMHTNFKEAITKSASSTMVGKIGGLIVQQFAKSTDCIIHVSKTSMIESGLDSNASRHEVINNGTKFTFDTNHEYLKQNAIAKFNIDKTKNNLLFVSRFVWEKNIKLLLDSFKKILQVNNNFSLTMVGGDWRENEIKEYAKELGIYDKIIWTGVIRDFNELKGLYLAHDLFVFPSVFDTFGLVVHEAASQKLPSLVIKNSAASENIIDGENGYTSDENYVAFANKIIEIFNNKAAIKNVGEAAAKLPFSWSEVVDKSINLYIDVIKKYYVKSREKRLEKMAIKIRRKFNHNL
ncbi:glycosyltransferase [Mycoplasma sp. CSL7475-4]|uniref:glycosyltransferase n=1 Tax=Mycoplasma sp. CSL7475-4 TaxID=2973942 RepID=UPI00216AE48F|nr:glycosyltransferase [Mycoplasma sp. CSL7475-4]MCS4536826.1 glycosyltransferase [Mycoplasma sp. CSL7475-4]